jgi:hypothetical protein
MVMMAVESIAAMLEFTLGMAQVGFSEEEI